MLEESASRSLREFEVGQEARGTYIRRVPFALSRVVVRSEALHSEDAAR